MLLLDANAILRYAQNYNTDIAITAWAFDIYVLCRGVHMEVRTIKTAKKNFLDLLLLADEQESMIDKYLERGDVFALYAGDLKSVCIVTDEGDGVYELKNIATYEQYQGQGYGASLLQYLFDYYKEKCKTMLVGTGDSPLTIPFYEKCGFTRPHIIPNFFIDNYDHPMFENGKQLIDMIYLKKDFCAGC